VDGFPVAGMSKRVAYVMPDLDVRKSNWWSSSSSTDSLNTVQAFNEVLGQNI